jgi:transposase
MAMPVQRTHVGIDVGKFRLDIATDDGRHLSIENTPKAIGEWLDSLDATGRIALEATSHYHLELALEAHRRGHEIFLINGYRLNRYRDSIGTRAKTDAGDARLLLRYLSRELDELRPWSPPSNAYRQLQTLLRRRATLVQVRVALQQSLTGIPTLKASLQRIVAQLKQTDQLIQKHIRQCLKEAGWEADAKRCQAIEGIGPVTAASLATLFHRGSFRNSDAFIAFLGLDVRVRDSGIKSGKRRLTRQGDPEARRLLYLAAMQAKRQPAWEGFYQRHVARGLAPTQALVALARKLARVAFSLMQKQTDYVPRVPCGET